MRPLVWVWVCRVRGWWMLRACVRVHVEGVVVVAYGVACVRVRVRPCREGRVVVGCGRVWVVRGWRRLRASTCV